MTVNWGVFLTPEFLIGSVVVALAVHLVGEYMVRSLDWLGRVLPAQYRAVRDAESDRVQRLTDAAISDHAIYAALAAEAGRFRSHQHLHFFFSFVCLSTLMLAMITAATEPGMKMGVLGLLLLAFLLGMALFQYSFGLDSGKRARRLDAALRKVHENLKLPIMD